MKKIVLVVALAGFAFAANAQTTKKEGDKQTTKTTQPKNTTASYTCPMCGGSYDKAGKCPKCGMDLTLKTEPTKVTDAKSGKEEKAKTYTCSMHPEIKQDKPGNCPKCGMALMDKK
ncbi:MAG: heavy metal-binding domain-containing protein [Bacteroidia bacterium]